MVTATGSLRCAPPGGARRSRLRHISRNASSCWHRASSPWWRSTKTCRRDTRMESRWHHSTSRVQSIDCVQRNSGGPPRMCFGEGCGPGMAAGLRKAVSSSIREVEDVGIRPLRSKPQSREMRHYHAVALARRLLYSLSLQDAELPVATRDDPRPLQRPQDRYDVGRRTPSMTARNSCLNIKIGGPHAVVRLEQAIGGSAVSDPAVRGRVYTARCCELCRAEMYARLHPPASNRACSADLNISLSPQWFAHQRGPTTREAT